MTCLPAITQQPTTLLPGTAVKAAGAKPVQATPQPEDDGIAGLLSGQTATPSSARNPIALSASEAPSAFEQLIREIAGTQPQWIPVSASGNQTNSKLPTAIGDPTTTPLTPVAAIPLKNNAVAGEQPQRPRALPALITKGLKAHDEAPLPAIAVALLIAPPIPVKLKLDEVGSAPQDAAPAPVKPEGEAKPEQLTQLDTAVQIRIRPQAEPLHVEPAKLTLNAPEARLDSGAASENGDHVAETGPQEAQRRPGQTASEIPVQAVSRAQAVSPGQTIVTAQVATVPHQVNAEVAARLPEVTSRQTSESPAAQAPTHLHEAAHEASPDHSNTTQPLRSVTLEFTPDGTRDVRLRLSEHSGEVHVSLHSTDAALTGRLREGVHDLAGSLARAGYDAEAWAPDQNQHNRQRQPADQRDEQKQRRNSSGQDAGEFGGILQQPGILQKTIEEIA